MDIKCDDLKDNQVLFLVCTNKKEVSFMMPDIMDKRLTSHQKELIANKVIEGMMLVIKSTNYPQI